MCKTSSLKSTISSVAHLRLHGLQHTRLPCPSPTPRTCSNLCPSIWWWHPTISSSVIPFSCLQSFPESGYFPLSQFFHQVAKVLQLQLQHQKSTIHCWYTHVHGLEDSSLSGYQIISKFIYRFHGIPIKMPGGCFVEMDWF